MLPLVGGTEVTTLLEAQAHQARGGECPHCVTSRGGFSDKENDGLLRGAMAMLPKTREFGYAARKRG